MAEWLELGTVTTVLGPAMSEQVDTASLGAFLPGVRGWVEDKRKDLFVTAGDPPVTTYEPTPQVVLGAAMLAWRLYNRLTTPLGVVAASENSYAGIIREDPDIARLLGIGNAGRFVFGATPGAVPVEVV